MKILKTYLFLFLPVLFLLGFIPELSAKNHHRNYRKSSRTSVSFNVNMTPRPYYNGYAGYAVAAPQTAYITQAPGYYQQVTVVQPYATPVYPVPVAVERPAVGLYLNPSFSLWGY